MHEPVWKNLKPSQLLACGTYELDLELRGFQSYDVTQDTFEWLEQSAEDVYLNLLQYPHPSNPSFVCANSPS